MTKENRLLNEISSLKDEIKSEEDKNITDLRCQHCGGCWDGEREYCSCGGGYVPHEEPKRFTPSYPCDCCGGSGGLTEPCPDCGGCGYY